ncbi:MAG: aa3-type cytochrome oxidase subunit CtaJ [Pseudonocardiaceae bacterium]
MVSLTVGHEGEAVGGQVDYRGVVTSLEVVLVMAGVPLAIMVLLGLLTLGPHIARTRRSYPGRKSNRPPVLWTVNPEELRGGSTNHKIRGAVRRGDRGDW